jgi:nicastrin
LLTCLTRNITCPMHIGLNEMIVGRKDQASSYSSVFTFRGKSLFSSFFEYFMANATAIEKSGTCKKDTDCKDNGRCMNKQCINSMTRYHDAYGTGLDYNYESLKWFVADESKGSWTESNWDFTRIRFFKISESTYVELITGVIVYVISLAIVCHVR